MKVDAHNLENNKLPAGISLHTEKILYHHVVVDIRYLGGEVPYPLAWSIVGSACTGRTLDDVIDTDDLLRCLGR